MSKERKFNESIVQPLELVEAVENSPRRIRAIGLISYAFIMIFASIHLAPADWWLEQNAR